MYFYQSRKANEPTFAKKRLQKSINYIKWDKMKNKIFLEALFKSDARSKGKQYFLYMALVL